MEDNYHLSNKKALFINMVQYYEALDMDPYETAIPLTFHIKHTNPSDPNYTQFLHHYTKLTYDPTSANIWIIKPGENTNRG
jgi:hypothetical protein